MRIRVTKKRLPSSRARRWPHVPPSLDIDFATGVLDSRITFTRSSSATRINASGQIEAVSSGVARFAYDPITLEFLGLQIEESRTNILLRSAEFDNASWVKGDITAQSNATTAPDGTTSADKLVASTTTNAYHYATQICSKSATATTYTGSLYVKAAGYHLEILLLNGPSSQGYVVRVDTTTGAILAGPTIIGTQFTGPSVRVDAVGSGWFRVALTATSDADTSIKLQATLHNGTSSTFTGDGTSGVFVWGAQLEAGAFPTSYIPTTTAAVTRAADVAVMTGTNFSSWYRQDEGTFVVFGYTTARHNGTNSFPRLISVSDGTANNDIRLVKRVLAPYTDDSYAVVAGGATQAAIDSNTNSPNVGVAVSFRTNAVFFISNGTRLNVDNNATIPTVTRLDIGGSSVGGILNGYISRLTFYAAALPDQQTRVFSRWPPI